MDGWVQAASRSGEVVGVLLDEEWPTAISIGSHGYPQVCLSGDGHVSLLHRVLLGLASGDGVIGDHINGEKLDCRRSNLRAVSASESSSNVSARTESGVRGVYRARSGRWVAKAKHQGRQHYLGTYDTAEDAAIVATAWRKLYLSGYVERSS